MERVNPVYPYLLEKMLGNIPDAYRVYPSPSLDEVIKKRKPLANISSMVSLGPGSWSDKKIRQTM